MRSRFHLLQDNVLSQEASAPTSRYRDAVAPAPEQAQSRLNEIQTTRDAYAQARERVLAQTAPARPDYDFNSRMQATHYDDYRQNTGMRDYGRQAEQNP